MYDDYYQIIAIITPDAHARADALIPYLAELAETHFHQLDISELKNLPS